MALSQLFAEDLQKLGVEAVWIAEVGWRVVDCVAVVVERCNGWRGCLGCRGEEHKPTMTYAAFRPRFYGTSEGTAGSCRNQSLYGSSNLQHAHPVYLCSHVAALRQLRTLACEDGDGRELSHFRSLCADTRQGCRSVAVRHMSLASPLIISA